MGLSKISQSVPAEVCSTQKRRSCLSLIVLGISQGNAYVIRVLQDSHWYKTAVSPKGFVLMHRGQWFVSLLDCNAVITCICASSLKTQRKISRGSNKPEVESELWSKESSKGWGVSQPNQSFRDKLSVLLSSINLLKILPPLTCKIFYCWPQRWQIRQPASLALSSSSTAMLITLFLKR